MAENNNITDITENFDTIKTLLNSIRAQGILNTSDVDKLLTGINSKLEKINTEEDIDLIKIFLSELKQNLEERHNMLISKFGAIESLFTNLLKNSSETLKTSEVKELFDIVATNLSVFSREVVSQKDILSDITLRIDAMRSDDTQKKEIIKNISNLKNDVDRLTNGFDSIVLSLNENFKTILKTISSIDPSENLSKFGSEIADVVNSSKTILSAIQVLDKKHSQVEDVLMTLATQDDMISAKKWISDLANHEQTLTQSIQELSDKYYKIDNLADKIDASVDIIVNLKSIIEENGEQSSNAIIDTLNNMQESLNSVFTNADFSLFKDNLEEFLKKLILNSSALQVAIDNSSEEINKISLAVSALDINANFKVLTSDIDKIHLNVKEHVSLEADKMKQIFDVNTSRTINEISQNAENIQDNLVESHSVITELCKKSFSDVADSIQSLKNVVSQIDENNVSANNAIFSNITDRLALFENSLKSSLEKQENYVSNSSNDLLQQVTNIKEISGVLDYKLDATSIQLNDTKTEFNSLKTSINDVLALDFVSKVKDLKNDLYILKQDLVSSMEKSTSDISDNLSNDLFSKYELLTSKLSSVEEVLKEAQTASLQEVKHSLENISSSIVDVLSYVSSKQDLDTHAIDTKIEALDKVFNDNNLNYIEAVRDVVEIIRTQVDENLKNTQEDTAFQISSVSDIVNTNAKNIKSDIQSSYNKLLEIQENFESIKSSISNNSDSISKDINLVIKSADTLKNEFDAKLQLLKNTILDKVVEFQQDFTCENADKISEIKFTSENLHTKNIQNSITMKEELKGEIEKIIGKLNLNIEELAEQLASTTLKVEGANTNLLDCIRNDLAPQLGGALNDIDSKIADYNDNINGKVSNLITKFDNMESVTNAKSDSGVEIVKNSFENILHIFDSLKMLISESEAKSSDDLKENVEILTVNFSKLCDKLNEIDTNIDEDFSRQLSILENNFEQLNQSIEMLFVDGDKVLSDKITNGLDNIADTVKSTVVENLNKYKLQVEDLFENISNKNETQAVFISEKALELNNVLNQTLQEQNSMVVNNINELTASLKNILDSSIQSSSTEYNVLIEQLDDFSKDLDSKNEDFKINLKDQIDSISKYIESGIENQMIDINAKFNDIVNSFNNSNSEFSDVKEHISVINTEIADLKEQISKVFEEYSINLLTQYNNGISSLIDEFQIKSTSFIQQFNDLNTRLDKDDVQNMNFVQNQIITLNESFENLISEAKVITQKECSNLYEKLITDNSSLLLNINNNLDDKFSSIINNSAEITAEHLKAIEEFSHNIFTKIDENRNSISAAKDFLNELVKTELSHIQETIEQESDGVVKDLLDQFVAIKDFEKDEFSKLTGEISGLVDEHIYNNINDLKSYLDVKTDTSILNEKLDMITSALRKSAEDMLLVSNKVLENSVFNDSIENLKQTNNILISTMAENLNSQLQKFITENVVSNVSDNFKIFDKKFTDSISDKYEEIKILSSQYKSSYERVEASVRCLIDSFVTYKDEISTNFKESINVLSDNISELSHSFQELKMQMMNKSFDEKFQASVNSQIKEIENIVVKQFEYLDDIIQLCGSSAPEITEMNTIIKNSLLSNISDIADKLDNKESTLLQEFSNLKSEIITQFINVFNQISFVTEQEEILDFIQDKHTELVKILSHIVNTTEDVEYIKESVSVVDEKVDTLKDDIVSINEKIAAIISSNGEIDYIYSLQDLESDIANLRISLNEIKDRTASKEFDELITSTNDIYKLVDSIKEQINCFNTDEFRKDFDSLNEDIVSISTRTNKLILASDESYKTLQENLQDFKLVINDLDERTRNFAQDSGMDKLDNKLCAINSMIQSGAKTNQVFNQVFEYLAEWVDTAGAQITSISDKVETLDDIGQIKVMLQDLKAESEDSSESEELVEVLGNIFDKQAKKISSLESKIDRMIVESTINSQNNKFDMKPMEDTLNRFLVAIDDKMASQQNKIDLLETKLADVCEKINPKDTVQLTKKVGGMDRQIAKLNKSIEKIASHVIEE